MPKILIVTVGGSPQPIITSVKTLKPNRVIFFCSGGPGGSQSQVIGAGKPCKIIQRGKIIAEFPNLPTHLSLDDFNPEHDLALVQEPDDPAECYTLASAIIRQLLNDYSPVEIMADYTGGTKTMSLSLGMAAMDYNINLFLTTSARRPDLVGVDSGESTELVSTSLIDVQRKIEQFLPLYLKKYQFPAAASQLQSLMTCVQMPPEDRRRIRCQLDFCKGYDAWDKFDHAGAWVLLQNLMGYPEIQPSGLFLKRVMASRAAIDAEFVALAKMAAHGYEIVQDLVLNAERRAAQQRYDDAVSRIYRALELLVQIRLWRAHKIKTSEVATADMPEAFRKFYKNPNPDAERVKLGLVLSYELLSAWPDDPLGQLYRQNDKKIQGILQIRNNSILAHGFTPITDTDYRNFADIAAAFIETAIERLCGEKKWGAPVQFPTAIPI